MVIEHLIRRPALVSRDSPSFERYTELGSELKSAVAGATQD
jgi:hypothetical protein